MRSLAVTCGHLLQRSVVVTCCIYHAVSCGHLRLLAVTRGHLRSLSVTCGHLLQLSCGHLRSLAVTKWPQVILWIPWLHATHHLRCLQSDDSAQLEAWKIFRATHGKCSAISSNVHLRCSSCGGHVDSCQLRNPFLYAEWSGGSLWQHPKQPGCQSPCGTLLAFSTIDYVYIYIYILCILWLYYIIYIYILIYCLPSSWDDSTKNWQVAFCFGFRELDSHCKVSRSLALRNF